MDHARDQPLAGAGLAVEQDLAHRALGDARDERAHGFDALVLAQQVGIGHGDIPARVLRGDYA